MEYFKELFKNIISTLIIKKSDSESEKAIKIIWYSIVGSVVVLVAISWLMFIMFTFGSDIVKVPMLKGDDVYLALEKLYEKRLVVNVNAKYIDEIDAGLVYKQSPKQGSIVKKGRIITIYVSRGPRNASLEDFVKSDLLYVEKRLREEYPEGNLPYEIDMPEYEYNEKYEFGKIIKQEPEAGSPLDKVKKVKFWVSSGPKDRNAKVISNFIGKNIFDVSDKLADLEIYYTYVFENTTDKNEDMIIVDQSIEAGKSVEEVIEEDNILILKVKRYYKKTRNKVTGTYLLDLPKKPIPYLIEASIKHGNKKEKRILKLKSKGGVPIPIAYSGEEDAKILIYFDKKFYKEILIKDIKEN